MENLERVGELTIQNNANLDDLSQLSGLVAVAEDMRVKGNGRLRSFATPNLESIGGNLVIERNQGEAVIVILSSNDLLSIGSRIGPHRPPANIQIVDRSISFA